MLREPFSSFQQFARETVAAVTAFLGGAVVLIGGILLDYLGWSVPTPYTTAGGILLMFWGMFWAYHKQRLKHVEGSQVVAKKVAELEDKVRVLSNLEPEMDDRLEILSYRARLTQHTDWDRQTWEALNMDPTPDHFLEVLVGAKVEIDATGVVVECNGQIYRAGAFWREPKGEIVASIEHSHRLPERVLVPFLKRPLPARTVFTLHLYGEPSMRVRLMKPYQQGTPRSAESPTPPAAPPRSKSGS